MNEQSQAIRPLRASNREIIKRAEQFTRRFAWTHASFPANLFTINFDYIYEHFIYPEYGIILDEDCDLGYDGSGKKILGVFEVDTNTVQLDKVLNDRSELVSRKRTFTCWHEVGGHAILQGEWLRAEMKRLGHLGIATTEDSLAEDTESTLERQANTFAAHAAAPTWFLDYVLRETYLLSRPIRYTGPCKYSLHVRGVHCEYKISRFNELCRIIAKHVQYRFGGLSIESLSYRIAASKWLTNDGIDAPPMTSSFRLFRAMPVAVGGGTAASAIKCADSVLST